MASHIRLNVALALVMVVAVVGYVLTSGEGAQAGGGALILGLFFFAVLMVTYAGMADESVLAKLQGWIGSHLTRALLPSLVLLGIGVGYLALVSTISARALVAAGIYLFVPTLLLWWDRNSPQRFTVFNVLALLIFWWMIEFGLLPSAKVPPGINLFQLIAFNIAIFSFLVVRRLEGVGYRLKPTRGDWSKACVYAGLFFAFFAIPVGLATQFIRPTQEWRPLWQFPIMLLGIFFFTGIPEEFVFRGVLHNLLARTLPSSSRSQGIALGISSVIFGLAHLNNPAPPLLQVSVAGFHYAVPWVYVVLATIAGWFYGLAYIRTGSILAAAILHTLVDGWWGYFFGG